MKVLSKKLAAAVVLATLPLSAVATNGYFQHGFGVISQGMAGAATATTKDAMGGANNPASMVWVASRMDAGITLFNPKRQAERSGNQMGLNGESRSKRDYFLLPGFGINRLVHETISLGVTVYGNGGSDTHYADDTVAGGNANLLAGAGELGVKLEQVVIAPTVAFKLNEHHSFGLSPLLTYQRFKAFGLSSFRGMSADPDNVTDNGSDYAQGLGVRMGWLGKLSDRVNVGASYSPQTRMSKFDKYQGLFAQQGRFDVPENYSLGLAINATKTLNIAFDYQRINYSNVRSVGNPSSNQTPLGTDNGPGFGWDDISVYKLGLEYIAAPRLTLRTGYSHSDNPISGSDVTFNILAPGVVQQHATIGATLQLSDGSELSFAYTHAFHNSVSGNSLFGGTEKIQMRQNGLGVSYGVQF